MCHSEPAAFSPAGEAPADYCYFIGGTMWNFREYMLRCSGTTMPIVPADSIRNLFPQKTVLSSRGASFPVGCISSRQQPLRLSGALIRGKILRTSLPGKCSQERVEWPSWNPWTCPNPYPSAHKRSANRSGQKPLVDLAAGLGSRRHRDLVLPRLALQSRGGKYRRTR